jgi:hypothetical protein
VNWAVIREPTIVVTSAVYGVLIWICLRAGIFAIAFAPLLFVSIWRYCYAVLRTVARGHKRIPPPDVDSFNLFGEWSLFWHFVAFPGVVFATMPYQPLGSLAAALVAVTFPASAAMIGVSSSLAQAFNPAALIEFARTLRGDYWALVLGFVAIIAGTVLIDSYVVPRLGVFSTIAGLMIMVWALLASFALIGSALRAHRLEFEIGGELKPREERALELRHAEWRRTLDLAYAAFRSGLASSGYKTLHQLADANGDSIEVNYWLVENMLEWEDRKYALEVAVKLMPRLLARDDAAGALELYQRCHRRDPAFRPAKAEAERLAEYAQATGHAGLADELSYGG